LKRIWPLLRTTGLFAALFTVSAGVAPAVATEPALLLTEAISIAQDRSHRLAAARQALAIAAGGEKVAKADFYPELAATAFWGTYDGDVFFSRFVNPMAPGMPNPEAPPTDTGSLSDSQTGLLKMNQTLYAGGALTSRLRASRLELQIAEQKLHGARLELIYETTVAYYAVLLSERGAKVAQQSVRRSEETVRAVAKRRAAEEALRVEELGAESHLAGDQHRQLQAENDVRFARRALNRLLARPADAVYSLSDALEAPVKSLDEDQAVTQALAGQPAAREAELRVSLAETLAKAGRAHFKPKLELEAFYSYIDNETFFKGIHYGAVLNFSIPFFKDVAAGGGERQRSVARRQLETEALEELLSAIRLQAREAVRRTEEAYSAVEVLRRVLAYQQEKHRVTASAFREQLATVEDLLNGETDLVEAELGLDRGLYQARLSEAELGKILGGSR
jgi:outer membrane protein TolC